MGETCKVCGLDYLDCSGSPSGYDPCPGKWSKCECGGRIGYCGYSGDHQAWQIKQLQLTNKKLLATIDRIRVDAQWSWKQGMDAVVNGPLRWKAGLEHIQFEAEEALRKAKESAKE